MWKLVKHRENEVPVLPHVVPLMDRGTMQQAVKSSASGTALALLVYTEDSFEIVSGNWNVHIEENGYISYWVADRLVALLGADGTPEVVPSLQSLQIGYQYPLNTLTTEMMPELKAAS